MSREDNDKIENWPYNPSASVEMIDIEKAGLVAVLKNATATQNLLMEISQSPCIVGDKVNAKVLEAITKSGYIVGALKYHVGDI